MSVTEVYDELVQDPEAAAKLRLVDDYIAHRQRAGRRFVLPKEHEDLEPLIQAYDGQFAKFVAYVKRLRDEVPPRSDSYISLHELYRTLDVRLVQQQRRERAKRAMDLYEKKNPKATYDEKIKWLRKTEQVWGRRRMAAMEDVRRKTVSGRLSTEEREEVLKEFWAEVDKDLAAGKLP